MKPSTSLFFVTKLFCGSGSGFSALLVDADAIQSPALHVPKLLFYIYTFFTVKKARKKEK
jgi:hypothetical protein